MKEKADGNLSLADHACVIEYCFNIIQDRVKCYPRLD